jgi:hypothetical protein
VTTLDSQAIPASGLAELGGPVTGGHPGGTGPARPAGWEGYSLDTLATLDDAEAPQPADW